MTKEKAKQRRTLRTFARTQKRAQGASVAVARPQDQDSALARA